MLQVARNRHRIGVRTPPRHNTTARGKNRAAVCSISLKIQPQVYTHQQHPPPRTPKKTRTHRQPRPCRLTPSTKKTISCTYKVKGGERARQQGKMTDNILGVEGLSRPSARHRPTSGDRQPSLRGVSKISSPCPVDTTKPGTCPVFVRTGVYSYIAARVQLDHRDRSEVLVHGEVPRPVALPCRGGGAAGAGYAAPVGGPLHDRHPAREGLGLLLPLGLLERLQLSFTELFWSIGRSGGGGVG